MCTTVAVVAIEVIRSKLPIDRRAVREGVGIITLEKYLFRGLLAWGVGVI